MCVRVRVCMRERGTEKGTERGRGGEREREIRMCIWACYVS